MGVSDNSARHFKRVVTRFGLSFQVPISMHKYTAPGGVEHFEIPYLKPVDFMRRLLTSNPDFLLGGHDLGLPARRILSEFWSNFKKVQPQHAVYQKNDFQRHLPFTIPYCLHGDGGRTAKKQPLEVVSLEPVLGLTSAESGNARCRCKEPHVLGCQRLNSKYNTYLSRFLICAFPGKKYPDGLLLDIFRSISEQLAALFWNGIEVEGKTYFFACLGLKGDMDFHAHSLSLTRSYHNLGTKNTAMVCVECHAGGDNCPFEDTNPGAIWESTICATFPWQEEPPFSSLPFESWMQLPSRAPLFFRRDPFHVFRLGCLVFEAFLSCVEAYCIMWGGILYADLSQGRDSDL